MFPDRLSEHASEGGKAELWPMGQFLLLLLLLFNFLGQYTFAADSISQP